MNKRPLSITIISWLFIAVGGAGLIRGLLSIFDADGSGLTAEAKTKSLVEITLVALSGLLAAIGGVFTLYGCNWARWLLVIWMGLHVILRAMHSAMELLVHGLLFAPILYFLFRTQSSAYFGGTRAERV